MAQGPLKGIVLSSIPSDRSSFQASDVLSRFTLSQIVWLAFGGTIDIDWMHKRQVQIGHDWSKYAAMHAIFGNLVQWIPFSPAWRCMSLRREVENAVYDVLKQIRAEGSAPEANGHAQNLLSVMINATDPKTGRAVTDKEIVEEASTLLFAGFDTTSTTMSWALYYMSRDPDSMRWAQQELDEILGYGSGAREPTMEDIPKLKRTRAILNESLRLRPPVGAAGRLVTRDAKVAGYDVPADTVLSCNVLLAQRNPKYWDAPHDFKPQRWEEDDSDDADAAGAEGHKKKRHPFAFIPFFAGARNWYDFSLDCKRPEMLTCVSLQHWQKLRHARNDYCHGHGSITI